MAIITVRIETTDAAALRIDAAFGNRANVQTRTAAFIKERVAIYEAQLAQDAARANNETLIKDEMTAHHNAYQKAKTEIIIT